MSRRSLYTRERLLQRGQVLKKKEKSQHEMRERAIPSDAYGALSQMMRSALTQPSEDKIIRLSARYTGRR